MNWPDDIVGIESFTINPAGKYFAGICAVKELGHISAFYIERDPVVCPKTTCPCPGDFCVSKKRVAFE